MKAFQIIQETKLFAIIHAIIDVLHGNHTSKILSDFSGGIIIVNVSFSVRLHSQWQIYDFPCFLHTSENVKMTFWSAQFDQMLVK